MKKIYDCAVPVGVKKDGKKIWKNVGALMEGEHGQFIMLDKSFNPAGIESDGRFSILISLFAPRENSGGRDAVSNFDQADPNNEDGMPF